MCHFVPFCATRKTPLRPESALRISFCSHEIRSGPRLVGDSRTGVARMPWKSPRRFPPMFTISRRFIPAPDHHGQCSIRLHGILVRCHPSPPGSRRVTHIEFRTIVEKNVDTPNFMADEELGIWPKDLITHKMSTRRKSFGTKDVSTCRHFRPPNVCVCGSFAQAGPFSLPGDLRARHVPAKL